MKNNATTDGFIANANDEFIVPLHPPGTRYTSGDAAILSPQDAQALGEELERIAEDDIPVTPAILVLRAKDMSHPLHKHFQWNNTLAGFEYRKAQARRLIQSLQVVLIEPSGPRVVRSHYSVATTREERPQQEYISVRRARDEPLAREQVFAKAVQELRIWAHKYEAFGLDELAPVYEVAARFSK